MEQAARGSAGVPIPDVFQRRVDVALRDTVSGGTRKVKWLGLEILKAFSNLGVFIII